MTKQGVTFDELAESLFKDMLNNIVRQHSLVHISRYRSIQETLGTREVEMTVKNNEYGSSKDIFGHDKGKIKTSEGSKYFNCDNCDRKIAGARFAQHIKKCLERKRR